MTAPANLVSIAMDIQQWRDVAEVQVTGTLEKPMSEEQFSEVNRRTIALSRERTLAGAKLLGTPQWNAHVKDELEKGTGPLGLFATSKAAEGAIDAMLASYVTGAWTAFEALAVDLWETALNEHPMGLANLDGKLSRLTKTKQTIDKSIERDSKSVPLNFINRFEFDIRHHMGTLFLMQRRYEFTRLQGIRAAYVEAFSKDYEQLDPIVTSDALDALSVVRNLLVHKAGIVDAEYEKRAKNLRIPKLAVGQLLKLDGETVVGLIKPVFALGGHLIAAVDRWIEKH